ncbi:MAG: signal peptidase II [Halanaerobiales bacterium]
MFILVILLTFIADQWLKIITFKNLDPGQSLPIWQDVFHITYVQNTGAAFGILKGKLGFFIVLTLSIIVAIWLYRIFFLKENLWFDISLGLIIGGATGNLIDRIRLGYVIDYIDFQIWPVFNLADTAIVIGAGFLIYYLWKMEKSNSA